MHRVYACVGCLCECTCLRRCVMCECKSKCVYVTTDNSRHPINVLLGRMWPNSKMLKMEKNITLLFLE